MKTHWRLTGVFFLYRERLGYVCRGVLWAFFTKKRVMKPSLVLHFLLSLGKVPAPKKNATNGFLILLKRLKRVALK